MLQRATNYYDDLFVRLIGDGVPQRIAVEQVATAYLDGKPLPVGKKKLTKKERDGLFWASAVVTRCPPDDWGGEAMSLALARYLGQEPVAADGLVTRVAREAPETLIRAVRHAGLVLNPHSPRRFELGQAASESEAVAEICRVLDLFALAHRERVAALEAKKAQLAELSVFDLLIYASLYSFEVLVPRDFKVKALALPSRVDLELAWDALGDLLAWKLAEANASSLKLTDDSIGRSIARHLRPVLFESGTASAGEALRNLRAFHALMDMQIELNEFISRSADAFSYDEGIRFERRGDRLEIVEVDPAARAAWQRDGLKLDRLHGYWFHRAVDTYVEQVAADRTTWMIGRPENAEANRLAWLRALQAQLRLREAYGVADEVTSDSGDAVDLFRALLSLNLMSVFFQQDFLAAFAERLDRSGDWVAALQRLTMDGLREGLQNRMPLTWSSRDSKVSNITGWTVTASEPAGNPRMASAILDFWTYDMVSTAERLQRKEPGLQPDLFERPVLKFGATLVQLPWVVGVQNNSTAAINNLRRLGARRGQARDEARRIEAGIARLLEKRGFRTLLNWVPPRGTDDAGEVDLIAVLDGHLFVIEVKSTFMRRSQRDAWLHATTTLRKAGQQLRRKVEAVSLAMASDPGFCTMLGLAEGLIPIQQHVWIADTCIECDHQWFGGFLKISVEELLIALRDDRHLLNDPGGLLAGNYGVDEAREVDASESGWSLYPDGFSAERFA
ncbi:MAG: YraN family protein, partial [Dehalococcoidia bacterium]|nr:YraN family protein [Dehalococcoidia bacterium]